MKIYFSSEISYCSTYIVEFVIPMVYSNYFSNLALFSNMAQQFPLLSTNRLQDGVYDINSLTHPESIGLVKNGILYYGMCVKQSSAGLGNKPY